MVIMSGPEGTGRAWPMGPENTYASDGDLPALLYDSGIWHARRTLELLQQMDRHELLQSAISCGVALELCIKSFLAKHSPALLAKDEKTGNSILLLTGNYMVAGDSDAITGLRTIEADTARVRANHILIRYNSGKEITDLGPFIVRNAAAHMGLVHQPTLKAAATSMVEYIELMFPTFDTDPIPQWGGFAAVAQALLDKRKTDVDRSIEAKRATALRRLNDRTVGLSSVEAERVLNALSGGELPNPFGYMEQVTCPVCNRQGWVMYQQTVPVLEYDADNFEETARMTLEGYLVRYQCPVCFLHLHGPELDAFSWDREVHLVLDADGQPRRVGD